MCAATWLTRNFTLQNNTAYNEGNDTDRTRLREVPRVHNRGNVWLRFVSSGLCVALNFADLARFNVNHCLLSKNYIPELVREDIPQALRGQRNVIFGNVEKIYEFHSQHFLRELEQCEQSPMNVGQCFLRHVSPTYLFLFSFSKSFILDLLLNSSSSDRHSRCVFTFRKRNSTFMRCTTRTNRTRIP